MADTPPSTPPPIYDPDVYGSYDEYIAAYQKWLDSVRAQQKKDDRRTRKVATRRRRRAGGRAIDDVSDYFKEQGLKPRNYQSQIRDAVRNVKSTIPRDDKHAGQYFTGDLGEQIYDQITQEEIGKQQHDLSQQYQPGWSQGEEFGGNIADESLQSRYDDAKTYIDRSRDRGTLSSQGYQHAIRGLDEQRLAAQQRTTDIDTSIEADYQQQLRDMLQNQQDALGQKNLEDLERDKGTKKRVKRTRDADLSDEQLKQLRQGLRGRGRKAYRQLRSSKDKTKWKDLTPEQRRRYSIKQPDRKFGLGKDVKGNVDLSRRQARQLLNKKDLKKPIQQTFRKTKYTPGDFQGPVGGAQDALGDLRSKLEGQYDARFLSELGQGTPLFDYASLISKGGSLQPVRGAPNVAQAMSDLQKREEEQRGLGNVGTFR